MAGEAVLKVLVRFKWSKEDLLSSAFTSLGPVRQLKSR